MAAIRLICLVLFAIVSATLAKHLYEPRIINGHDAKEGQFPYMVSLRDRDDNGHWCGASILSSRFLLTAAHCCASIFSDPKNMYAIVGATRLSRGGVHIELDKIVAHKGFDYFQEHGKYDVAVIRTANEIVFSDLIQPIALPTSDFPDDRAVKVVLSGWGRLEVITNFTISFASCFIVYCVHVFLQYSDDYDEEDVMKPEILQFNEYETISRKECANRFANVPHLFKLVHEANICTMPKKNDSVCHGDSGNLMINQSHNQTILWVIYHSFFEFRWSIS